MAGCCGKRWPPALGGGRTRVFDLPNGDLVAIAPPPAPALEEAARALRRTLDLADGTALARLRLPDAAAELLVAASGSLGLEPAAAPALGAAAPLGSEALARAERDLAGADLEPFLRRLTVCELVPGAAAPRPLWQDLRLDWPALAAALLPGTALGEGEGLPARLARHAAARILAELARPVAQLRWRPTGLTLPPAVLTGGAFRRFDAALPAGRRAEVTIGFRPADILADPGRLRRRAGGGEGAALPPRPRRRARRAAGGAAARAARSRPHPTALGCRSAGRGAARPAAAARGAGGRRAPGAGRRGPAGGDRLGLGGGAAGLRRTAGRARLRYSTLSAARISARPTGSCSAARRAAAVTA
jgi:hypothetical protein